MERIKDRTIKVQPKVKISVIKEKNDDNRILECAVEGKAQHIKGRSYGQLQFEFLGESVFGYVERKST